MNRGELESERRRHLRRIWRPAVAFEGPLTAVADRRPGQEHAMRFMKSRVLATLSLAIACLVPAAAAEEGVVAALVQDTSGSIRPGDLQEAGRLTAELFASLPAGSRLSLFSFDDSARLVQKLTDDPEEMRYALTNLTIRGNFTALNDAIFDAVKYLEQDPSPRKLMLLITDGRDEKSVLKLDDALDFAREGGVRIYTVGVGNIDRQVLRRIAKLTGGDYDDMAVASGRRIALASAEAFAQAAPTVDIEAAPGGDDVESPPPPATDQPPRVEVEDTSMLPYVLIGSAAVVVLVLLGLGVRHLRRPDADPSSVLCRYCGTPLASSSAACPVCTPEYQEPAVSDPAPGAVPEPPPARDSVLEVVEPTARLTPKGSLYILEGEGAGTRYDLDTRRETLIGRSAGADICLADTSVSQKHCRIKPSAGWFMVYDLGSTNGTLVNDSEIKEYVLSAGDRLQVGETVLEFQADKPIEIS